MALDPIDYSLKAPDITTSIMGGYDAGTAFREAQRKTALEMAKQQAEQDRKVRFEADMAKVTGNPNATFEDYQRVLAYDPKSLAEPMIKAWEAMDKSQRSKVLLRQSQVYNALRTGNSEVATDILKTEAAGYRNAGLEQEAKQTDQLLRLIKEDKDSALAMVGANIFSAPEGKDIASAMGLLNDETRKQDLAASILEKSQGDARKSTAEAEKAVIETGAAGAKELLGLEKTQAEIQNLKDQIKVREKDLELKRYDSDLKRQELEVTLTELKKTAAEKERTKNYELRTSEGVIDNMLAHINKALAVPDNVMKAALGPIDSMFPTVQQDVANFEETLTTLSSQAFLSQVPMMRGMGSLTQMEGQKLESSLQSFSTRQSPKQLKENLQTVRTLMKKHKDFLRDKYGAAPTAPKSYSRYAE